MCDLKKMMIENGITYNLGEDGMYYPDFEIPKGTNYDIGKFGRMRAEFLKEYRHSEYMELMLSGELNQYLHEFEEECNDMMGQMMAKEGVTEELKAKDQMKWVGMVNGIRMRAEGFVVREVVCC